MDQQYLEFVKSHKETFINYTTKDAKQLEPKTAIFMAGTPGSGKTEVANELLSIQPELARIDADEYRALIDGYDPHRAKDFQHAATRAVDIVYSYILKHGYSFLLDGTFASATALLNIERALKRDYQVTVVYVYQEPEVAWQFTKERERKQERNVPMEAFIRAYFASRDNMARVMTKYGDQVKTKMAVKDYANRTHHTEYNVDKIVSMLKPRYNEEALRILLGNNMVKEPTKSIQEVPTRKRVMEIMKKYNNNIGLALASPDGNYIIDYAAYRANIAQRKLVGLE